MPQERQDDAEDGYVLFDDTLPVTDIYEIVVVDYSLFSFV